ncbi:MAG: glycosyltransferase [Lewinellaceae bacterium]|nr:glycosyltransferase [Saprospiraceae bacterium]MCB9338346.1 glycosyltransferase [Lewinellaceae bacterium]
MSRFFQNDKSRLLAVIYSHPEGYPPTLNALTQLSGMFDEVSVLYRPVLPVEWEYGDNVRLHPSGDEMHVREQEALPIHKKMLLFANFVRDFRQLIKTEQPDVVLLYDPLATLAFSFVRSVIPESTIVWYHNHDVLEAAQRKYSLNWFAYRTEKKMFPYFDMFSLPAQERRQYFPMENLKGQYFFLPNQPAISLYSRFQDIEKTDRQFRVIFQGHVAEGHGIEEILSLMPCEVQGRPLHLVLKGWIRDDFKEKLLETIKEKGLENQVEFAGYTAYQELPKLTASCHVGIAIHTKTDIMNKTLGTASNKIYEYAAVGLPVLYFDNPHFKEHLGRFEWAMATDVSPASLKACFEKIAGDFERLSAAAKRDFRKDLNFEHHFRQVGDFFEKQLAEKTESVSA